MRRHLNYLFFLCIIFITVAIQFMGENGLTLFKYQREDILLGQWWRLVSGHFVHLNWKHLILNNAGLVVIWMLYRRIVSQRAWWLLALGSIIVIDIGLLVIHPDIKWYVGLSGILHGLFAGGAIMNFYLFGKKGSLFLVLLIVKLVWEQFSGPLPGSAELSGGRVITEAHLYGAIGGSLTMLLLIRGNRASAKKIKHS
jgi:rhomboid family GlyGly-CTERM serine protease